MDIQEKIKNISNNLKQFYRSSDCNKAVLGLSGGVDSALVAKIATMAFGAENITALIMPNEGITDPKNVNDAESWAKELGINHHIIHINTFVNSYEHLPWNAMEIAKMNVQARVRANILYHYANSNNALVLGTGNKSEVMLGYFTKYGDAACDVQVIGNLYKTEVWDAARVLKLPESIIQKKPTAELISEQTDEEEIGISYNEIDATLKSLEENNPPLTDTELELHERIVQNKHKRKMPPIIRND